MKNKLIKLVGFTLIELLVAITIFSTVILIVTDITLDVIRADAISSSYQVALDSGRFILQRIAKAIRISVVMTTDTENSIDPTTIELDHPRRGTVEYFLSGDNRIVERIGGDPATDSALDASTITIEKFSFKIQGADGGTDGRQPQVTLSLKIKPPKARQKDELASILLQTTLSQRCFDIYTDCDAIP